MIWDLEYLAINACFVHAFIDRRTTVIVETDMQLPSTAHFFRERLTIFHVRSWRERLWPPRVGVFSFYFLAINTHEMVSIISAVKIFSEHL